MNEITLDDLLDIVDGYSDDDKNMIRKAYSYADNLHDGQFRQSGDAYITHPLNVAYILADMHADSDTICAGLLHDVLEDTSATKEDIAHDFNKDISLLVDGVTKLAKMNFSSKQDLNYANTRKIITGITEDVRIIIVKLADRLHNMRTLQFKSEFKRQENAIETMEIFVPLAYYIGAYRIKSELEDLSLRYIKPSMYQTLAEKIRKIEIDSKPCIDEMLGKINMILNDNNISNEIKVRTKNIYGLYKRVNAGCRFLDIHDLIAFKIMVDDVSNCYLTLGLIHDAYHPINERFKDYICNPKTNMYRSLHTTVFGPDDRLVQTQIRTFDMDKIASFGLTAYWDISKGNARDLMQKDLKEKYQFFKSLKEMNSLFCDNQEFVNQVKSELFADKIYVYTSKGEILELPKGSTVIDFAYKIHTDIGNTMVGAYVNDEYVPVGHVLHNKDRVIIITDDLAFGPKREWLDMVYTSHAKKKIKEFNEK